MRFITEKANQLQLLRQQQQAVVDANNNVKKAISAASNKVHYKTNNAANKKGGQKQNNMGGMKERNVGFDQKTVAALKLNNAHLGGGESLNLGEGKRASDIGAVMNLAGFNGGNVGNATVLGGNSIGLGGFPVQSNMIQGNCSAATAIPNGGYAPSMLMNMNGFNHPSPKMNMSMMQTRPAMQQQPQMMYHRSLPSSKRSRTAETNSFRECNPTVKPQSFHGLVFFFLMLPMLLSLRSVSALPTTGLIEHPTPRPATGDPLVLAANRTKRPDILRGFRHYQGGWDIANHHYWASVGYTGGAGFVLAFLWLISFGLALAIHICCGWGIEINDLGLNHSQRICLMLLILFTCSAATGCILIFVGQEKFHGEALDTLRYVVNQSDYTEQILRNVTEYFSLAKTANVSQILLPSDVIDEINKLSVDLNKATDGLSEKKNEYAVKFQKVFKYGSLALFFVAAVMLLLALTGLALSVLGYQHAIRVFAIIGWLLVATTFILFGVFMILDNAISDTCMATGEWVANPHRESALSHVLPCVDQGTTNRTLIQSKEVVNNIASLVNLFIYETANTNGTQGSTLGLGYYNQSGPPMLPLCYPFDAQFQERPCTDLEVSFANASMVWKNNECKASASGICTTVGRVTPAIYAQLVATVNKSYALEHYTPFLLSLQNCNFVRDAFTGVTSSHCPTLNHYLRITSVGLGLVSVSVLICLILWILYVNLL